MRKVSVLSIPGVPNGWAPLDSKIYHDYESILEVIADVLGNGVETYFESFIWPREVPNKKFNWMINSPVFAVSATYLLYHLDAEYKERIVSRAMEYIRAAFEQSDTLFLILHSHGNRIAVDALIRLKSMGELEAKHIVVLAFAPAYKDVFGGYLPAGLTKKDLNEFQACTDVILNFRMKTDLLSGAPPFEKTFEFEPKYMEMLWLGHATIRSRSDVMEVLRKELKNSI